MPRYFFNVHGDTFAAPDLLGRELPDDESAKREAQRVAADVATYELSGAPFPDTAWIEVLNEDQRPVVLLPVETAAEPSRGS